MLLLFCQQSKSNTIEKIDSLRFSSCKVYFTDPGPNYKKHFNDEDSFGYTISIGNEKSMLCFTEGHNMDVGTNNNSIILQETVVEGVYSDILYKYSEDGEDVYHRIIKCYPYSLFIEFITKDPQKLNKYNMILNNIKVYKNR